MATGERLFPFDYPPARGHFPGNPIIPGAVLLNETLRTAEAALGIGLSPCHIKSAKFFYPVRPGDRVCMVFSHAASSVRFSCSVEGKTVLSGQVQCATPSIVT